MATRRQNHCHAQVRQVGSDAHAIKHNIDRERLTHNQSVEIGRARGKRQQHHPRLARWYSRQQKIENNQVIEASTRCLSSDYLLSPFDVRIDSG